MAHKVPCGFGPRVWANGVMLGWMPQSRNFRVQGSGQYMEEDDGNSSGLCLAHAMKGDNALCTLFFNHIMELLWGGKGGQGSG